MAKNVNRDLNAWQVAMLEKLVREEIARNPVAGLAALLADLEAAYKIRIVK